MPTTTPMRQQSRQPDVGPVGSIKGLLSQHIYSKKESWKTALSLTEKGQNATHQMNSTKEKKELLTLTPGDGGDGRRWSRWQWWWVRTSRANHKSMWQHFWVLRVKRQKVSLNRWPIAYTVGGGLSSHPTPSHVIRKWTVNTTLTKVIRLTWRTARNFHIFRLSAVHQMF